MPQPAPPQRSIAPIALKLGLITPDQLKAAEAEQAGRPGSTIDDILVRQNILTPDQIQALRKESNRFAPNQAKPEPVRLRAKTAPRPAAPCIKPSAPAGMKTWLIVGGIAVVVLIGVGLLVFKGSSKPVESAPPVVDKPTPPIQRPDPPVVTPPKPEPKAEDLRIRVTLRRLPGHSDLVQRWNEAADKINSMRDPEQFKPVLSELASLVGAAKGSEHEDHIADGHKDVIEAVRKRADQVFGWLADESSSLQAAGKFGDALKTWEWFPGNLDPVGTYARKIADHQKAARTQAEAYFGRTMGEVEALVSGRKFEEAHLLLLKALEIGIEDLYAKAEKRMTELTRVVDDAVKQRNEEELAAFERMKAAEKEAAKTAALYQDQFWKFVSERQLDSAEAFLKRQAAGAPGEIQQSLASMEKVLGEIRDGFAAAGRILERQAGKTVSLGFLEGGKQQNRSFLLKAVRDGKIVYTVEGRELTVPVSDLHSTELARLAKSGPEADRDFLTGLGYALDGAFDEAHMVLNGLGGRAQSLVGFVEKSNAFLARNVPVIKKKIEGFINDKQWEPAVQEFTKLASLPDERKAALQGRARAYYQLNNFMGAVSDIESLFEMDDFSNPTIELLNSAYKRSALIDKAIRMFEKANARVPQNGSILANLVELYMQIHEFKKAEAALARADKVQGNTQRLAGLAHLVRVALEPAFPGKTYKAMFGRYDLETNVSQEYATKMARFMDKVYQSYIKVFPYKKNETLRFHLKLFSTEGEFFSYYRRTTGADPSGPKGKILAYYMSVTKELVGWNAEGIEETLQHEGLHQYFDYFIEDCPIWFNEGYASFFETSTADEVRFNDGRHNTAAWLHHQNQLPSMKDVFMMSGDVFRAQGAFHYGTSWSVVYWFVKSGRKPILDRYFEALMEGKNQKQAFDAIFGPGKEDVDDFNAKWKKAVRTGNYDE